MIRTTVASIADEMGWIIAIRGWRGAAPASLARLRYPECRPHRAGTVDTELWGLEKLLS